MGCLLVSEYFNAVVFRIKFIFGLKIYAINNVVCNFYFKEKSSGVEDNDGEISKSETALEETRENLVLSECAD